MISKIQSKYTNFFILTILDEMIKFIFIFEDIETGVTMMLLVMSAFCSIALYTIIGDEAKLVGEIPNYSKTKLNDCAFDYQT